MKKILSAGFIVLALCIAMTTAYASGSGPFIQTCDSTCDYAGEYAGEAIALSQSVEPTLESSSDPAPAQFNWTAVLIPVWLVALVGIGFGTGIFVKRHKENDEENVI